MAICQHEEDVLLLLLLRGKANAKLSPGEVPFFRHFGKCEPQHPKSSVNCRRDIKKKNILFLRDMRPQPDVILPIV